MISTVRRFIFIRLAVGLLSRGTSLRAIDKGSQAVQEK
jgi:hypothetical protein